MASTLEAVRAEIRDALCDLSTDSACVVTRDGDLSVVFFDSSEAFIVKIIPAGLIVLTEADDA